MRKSRVNPVAVISICACFLMITGSVSPILLSSVPAPHDLQQERNWGINNTTVGAFSSPSFSQFQQQGVGKLSSISPVNNLTPVSSIPKVYNVTFSPQLQASSSNFMWFVNITGYIGSGPISPYKNYVAKLPLGTYNYTIGVSNRSYMPVQNETPKYSGNFTVKKYMFWITIVFEPVTYQVTFSESGLPMNTEWNLTPTARNTIPIPAFEYPFSTVLGNGTYRYTINNLTDYYPSSNVLNFTVDGGPLKEVIEFLHYSYISGSVTPKGSNITVNGLNITASNGIFKEKVKSGHYELTVKKQGYKTFSKYITLGVNKTEVVNVSLKPVTFSVAHVVSTLKNPKPYDVGGIMAVIVIAAISLSFRKKR